MKFFFIFNLYSSFKSIINNKKLVETGNITLIKLIKRVSIDNCCIVFLLDKNLQITKNKIKVYTIENIIFYILPFKISYKKIYTYFNLKSFFFLICKLLFTKTSSVYIDRGNIFLAFIIKSIYFHNIIIRILGITNQIENKISNNKYSKYLYRLIWKKKYDLIVHTNDGSNFKKFHSKFINPDSKKLILNQSVKKIIFQKKNPNKKLKILLSDNFKSEYKNFNLILNCLKNLSPEIQKKIIFYIVADNKNIKKLKSKLISFKNIKFFKRLRYNSLLKIKNEVDALISFNSQGYLSNNIIESIYYKNWIITPRYKDNIKKIPKKFLYNFIFIDNNNLKNSLNINLNKLIKKNNINNQKYINIISNEQKVEEEFNMLKSLQFIN